MRNMLLKLGTLVAIVSPVALVISCGNTSKEKGTPISHTDLIKVGNGFGGDVILNNATYNKLYDDMKTHEASVALALISNHKVYTDIVAIQKGWTVVDVLNHSKYEIKMWDPGAGMGNWMGPWRVKGDTDKDWRHGTRTAKNYSDYYPMYYINHESSQFGVSNWHASANEVYEVTYDDK